MYSTKESLFYEEQQTTEKIFSVKLSAGLTFIYFIQAVHEELRARK